MHRHGLRAAQRPSTNGWPTSQARFKSGNLFGQAATLPDLAQQVGLWSVFHHFISPLLTFAPMSSAMPRPAAG
jgi:hypothetical protein